YFGYALERTMGLRFLLAAVIALAIALPIAISARGKLVKPDPKVETTYGEKESVDRPLKLRQIYRYQQKIIPLHKKLGEPAADEWLANHSESGQTFKEYRQARPVMPRGKRTVLYVLPLGDFTESQSKIVELSAEFLSTYFHRPVRVHEALPLSVIPDDARRVHPDWGVRQILSTYVLSDVLVPRLPDDAAAYIALTASDLWPGDGWNFVFGQASLWERVGVWSMNRNGDPDEDERTFRLCLLRTLKTATHETGHMFSIKHCTDYECNMCGSNHLEESDRQPLTACPQCVAKLWWGTGADPAQRYQRLAEFCQRNQLTETQEQFEKAAAAVSQ
ncbi:MAG: archaemetzincin, partial [Planctomycetales bacterium]